MKILILTFGYPSNKNPQLGCFMMDQAKALQKAGHQVGLLAFNGRSTLGKSISFGLNHENIDGVECFEFNGIPFGTIKNKINKKVGLWLEKKFFPRIVSNLPYGFSQPDIIHAHFLKNIYKGVLIRQKLNVPLIGTEHWSKVTEQPVDPYIKDLCAKVYPEVDSLIAVSENLKNKIREYSGVKSKIIHNLIDISYLQPALEKTSNEKFTIVSVGSLIKRKGFDGLIEAISKSSLKDEDIIVKIIGGGEERGTLQKMINDKNLGNKIILTGRKSKPEIYEELHKADLFVLSSRLENFSVAIIEATANGLPAVATLCGGVEEYPVEEVIKIPTEDINAMKSALEEAYAKKGTFDRRSIQKQTLDNFAPEEIVKKTEAIYQEAIEKYRKKF